MSALLGLCQLMLGVPQGFVSVLYTMPLRVMISKHEGIKFHFMLMTPILFAFLIEECFYLRTVEHVT